MHTPFAVAFIVLALTVGCTARESDTNAADSNAPPADTSAGPAASADSTAVDSRTPPAGSSSAPAMPADSGVIGNPSSREWTVTPTGIGAIRVSMGVEELRRVAGDVTLPAGGGECAYVHPGSAPPGVSAMLANGQVARIDVDSAGVRTNRGATIGDTEARIEELYAGRVTTTPHKYLAGGHYLTVIPAPPADSARRIVFETEGGVVTRFRAGRLPEVSWVERCG